MRKWLAATVAVFVLSACQSSSERDYNECSAYSKLGSNEFAQCMNLKQQQRISRSSALMNFGGAMMAAGQPAPRTTVNTTCSRQGVYVNCTSY